MSIDKIRKEGKNLYTDEYYLLFSFMKILCFVSLFLFFSCSTSKTSVPEEEVSSQDQNFVDSYINTLESSVGDARDVAGDISQQQEDLKKSLERIE